MEKLQLLAAISIKPVKSKKTAQLLYTALLFLQAYPDNKIIYEQADKLLAQLHQQVQQNENLQYSLYNSGVTGTTICAAFGFEMVKWLKRTRRTEIKFNSFEADEDQVQAFISVLMSKAESEIFQDGNAGWKEWLRKTQKTGEDIVDQLIEIFESSDARPEVKDEIWNAIGINVEIELNWHCCLPASLIKKYYHKALIKKPASNNAAFKPVKINLSKVEAEQLIDCSKMILIRHLREIDPVSFTDANHISYYQLQRGYSIALIGMIPQRRHPIDSYMAYVVFKNGLPVSYGASWVLFNSSRIALNIFPDYRGGEAKYIFNQILKLHSQVYHLKRFSVDPYQIGKDNSDGVQSGSFWIYYHAGFRPLEKKQQTIAATEADKIRSVKKYKTSPVVLKTLAQSRLELVLHKDAVVFDATDLSRAYAGIIIKKYKGNRLLAQNDAAKKLATSLQIKNYQHSNMNFILKNWALYLLCEEKKIRQNSKLKQAIKKLFNLKASGSEKAYIVALQKNDTLKKIMNELVESYAAKN